MKASEFLNQPDPADHKRAYNRNLTGTVGDVALKVLEGGVPDEMFEVELRGSRSGSSAIQDANNFNQESTSPFGERYRDAWAPFHQKGVRAMALDAKCERRAKAKDKGARLFLYLVEDPGVCSACGGTGRTPDPITA